MDWGQAIPEHLAFLDADRACVFGSHAWGAAPRCSDLDLLVWQTSLPPLERIGRVPRTLGELPWGVEPVVLTPAELEERRRLPFLRSVLKEARLVYEP